MWARVGMVMLAGCGRINFDTPSDGGLGSSFDCISLRPLRVTTSSDPLVGDYSIGFKFDHAQFVANGASAAGKDLRMLYRGNEIDRVLGLGSAWASTTTQLWFRLQAPLAANATNDDYALCIGDGSLPAENPNRVYLIADDFEDGAIDTGRWQVSPGTGVTVTESGGQVVVAGTNTDVTEEFDIFGISSVASFDTAESGLFVESYLSINNQSVVAQTNWKLVSGYQVVGGVGAIEHNSESATDKRVQFYNFMTAGWVDLGDSGFDARTFSRERIQQVLFAGGQVDVFEGGMFRGSRSGLPNQAWTIGFGYSPDTTGGNETFDVSFDDVMVRRFVPSDGQIAVTFGPP